MLHDDIDLQSARLAVMLQIRLLPAVEKALEDLCRNPALEKRTTKRVAAQLIRVANSEKAAGQPAVEKMKLWRLDELFADLSMPGRSGDAEEARLEDAQPRPCRVVRNAGISAEGRQIDLLRRPSGREREERSEGAEFADVFHLPYVVFDVRRKVVGVPVGRIEPAVVDARIPSAKDVDPKILFPVLTLAPLIE